MRILVLAIATAGGVGLVPVAPGTAGSVLGAALWPLLAGAGTAALLAAIAAAVGLGTWAAGRAGRHWGRADDGRIVIDEVAGQLIALAFLPLRIEVALVGFALFRLFDIWKPPPLRLLEHWPGGLGVMADDIAAGLYANALGQLLWRLAWPVAGASA
jgi:phosphatidylglycerophosphatase A